MTCVSSKSVATLAALWAATFLRVGRPVAVAVSLAAVASLRARAEINDAFLNRSLCTGTNIVATGSNTNATVEPGEPTHAGNPGGKSVWWAWTAPADGEVIIKTDGSSFDTLLAVYTGQDVTTLNQVATNDDHGIIVTSRVRFEVNQGTQYQVAVDGYSDGTNTASGDITLTLNFVSGPLLRPANDNFTNSITLSGIPVATNVSNAQASRETREPIHAQKLGDTSVWFRWTAPTSEAVRISTEGSSFDTLLAVYSGTSLTNLTEVSSSDDIDPVAGLLQSALTFESLAGQTYRIAVDGFDGAQGAVALRIESARPSLSSPVRFPDGSFGFALVGVAGKTYTIETAGDSFAWSPLGSVSNSNGTVFFTDASATNSNQRIYRAFQQP